MSTDGEIDYTLILQGMKWLLRQLFLQMAQDEDLPNYLSTPRRFIELIATKGYKNLKLTEAFFNYLREMGVIRVENDQYIWESPSASSSAKGKTVIESEALSQREVQKRAMPLFSILRKYSERLPKVMKGNLGEKEKELIIWDSLHVTDLYQWLRDQAIKYGQIPPDSIILDVNCRTGWSTIDLIRNTAPRRVIAMDPDEAMIELAYNNIVAYDYQEKVQLVVADVIDKIELSGKVDVIFANLLFNRFEDNQLTDILFNIQPLLKKGGIFCGLQPIKANENVDGAELLLYSDPEFKGYPTFPAFITAFERSGFTELKIDKSMFFKARIGGESISDMKKEGQRLKVTK
ncbi:MAG: class I SAM-dependent methyltransferase [Candidatus Helarchaeota archaeon]